MSDYIEFEHAGLTVRIHTEEEASHADPRDNTNLGVMFCDYRGYDLGDKDAPQRRALRPLDDDDFAAAIVQYLKDEHGARVILPLFVYEHSGITMKVGGRLDKSEDDFTRTNRYPFDSAGWDTSSVGVIFDTAESRKVCGCEDFTDEQIEEGLRSEVSEYATYLEGNVFWYQVIDADGDTLDSCGGFIDADIWNEEKSHTYQEARSAAESCAQDVAHEVSERHEWACRDTVTV